MIKKLGTMNVYKNNGKDCSNGGISSLFDTVEIWNQPKDILDIPPSCPDNAVYIVEDVCVGKCRIRAIPITLRNKSTMFGGCFIYTSNGVVPHHGEAIKLHDRVEP